MAAVKVAHPKIVKEHFVLESHDGVCAAQASPSHAGHPARLTCGIDSRSPSKSEHLRMPFSPSRISGAGGAVLAESEAEEGAFRIDD